MESNKTIPKLVQNGIEMRKPQKLRTKEIFHLSVFLNVIVSATTVHAASTIEKAESIPRRNKVRPNMIAHPFDPGSVSTAVG